MAAKTIMKRIAIAALSAVILQGVTPLDSLNVYASENTGASYTALDLYTYIQDQCSTEYTLTEKAETFLEEHDDFFPASPELVIPDEMIDAELDFRHINKNPSRYGDKLMRISDAYVIQVQEEEMEEGLSNLSQYNNEVDFIISHCCATSTQKEFVDKTFSADSMTDYLELVKQRVNFKKWFFGHYHDNKNIGPKEILIYEQIIRIL